MGFVAVVLWMLGSAAPVAASESGVAASESGVAKRPNVLLVLVDDLKPAIGGYGDAVARTPQLDRFVASGLRFDRAYCNQAVCAPSRYTLMLGSLSSSTGLYGLSRPLRRAIPNAVTMPQHFAKHGWRTESLGKVFHIGHGNEGDPASFVVPHFAEKVIEYVDPASTGGGMLTREEAYFANRSLDRIGALPRGAVAEGPDVADDAYADGRVAAEAIRRLRAAKERRVAEGTPFFVAVGFARPHLPFSVPKRYWDLYDPADLPMPSVDTFPQGMPAIAGKRGGEIANYFPAPDQAAFRDGASIDRELTRRLIHGYYASVSYVDAQIGKVLDAVRELGLDQETIVVLWGDHGFHLGDLGMWTKHTNFEQATRIPLVIRAPGVTGAGASTGQPVGSVDIFPTLAELAGLPAPVGPQPIDGVSLVPVLRDPQARVRDHTTHVFPRGKVIGRGIRDERYRLVEWKRPGDDRGAAEIELYDYRDEAVERRNVAGELPQEVGRLRAILDRYPEAVPE
jgi:iduronate 2-sulfatase